MYSRVTAPSCNASANDKYTGALSLLLCGRIPETLEASTPSTNTLNAPYPAELSTASEKVRRILRPDPDRVADNSVGAVRSNLKW